MPYCARKHQLSGSLLYHIINRGNKRETIFRTAKDYLVFVNLLKEYSRRFDLKIYHWVLMPNHYHLLLEIAEPGRISACMAGLNRAYTCYYHRIYFTAGFLWQGRFKLQPVQKETHIFACGRYIERNPVRAGLVSQAEGYPYSSARFYCLSRRDGVTTEDPAFVEFGQDIQARRAAYKEFLCNFNTEEEEFYRRLDTPQGDKEFVRRLIKQHGRYLPKKRGRPAQIIVS